MEDLKSIFSKYQSGELDKYQYISEMHKKHLLTVILPTYNRLERLRENLPSFLQTESDQVKFLVIDNCSTDGTFEYLQELAKSDYRINVIKNNQNIGGVKSIFKGYSLVETPYAMFLADDDLMKGEYLDICIDIFKQNPSVGCVHHLFDGWQRGDELENFTIYPRGIESIKQIYMKSGSYPGLAWRMDAFNLKDFPLGKGDIYPQIKVSLDIAKKHDIAIIHGAGLCSVDYGDSIETNLSIQGRPDDYGVNERARYLIEVKDNYILHELSFSIAGWSIGVLKELKKLNKKKYFAFIYSLSDEFTVQSPAFIIKLIQSSLYFELIISIFFLLRKPMFVVNYTFSTYWFYQKILKKIKFYRLKNYYYRK